MFETLNVRLRALLESDRLDLLRRSIRASKACHTFPMGSLISNYSQLAGRIAIFGGTFDPVQNAHIEIAAIALGHFDLSKILFVPAKQNPLKANSPLASDEDRLKMLAIALEDKAEFEICDLEMRRRDSEPSFTIETVRELEQLIATSHELFLILGTDNLRELHRWKSISELLEIISLPIIINRRDGEFEEFMSRLSPELQPFATKFQSGYLCTNPMPHSSTQIRKELSSGNLKQNNLLPNKVLDYIIQHRLYQS